MQTFLRPTSLVPRLVAEFGYSLAILPWSTKSEVQLVAEQLSWSKRAVREAFTHWWTTGEVSDLTVGDVDLATLLKEEEPYRPVRAFLRMARLARMEADDTPIGLRAESFTEFGDEFRASIGRLDERIYLVRHVSAFTEIIYEVYEVDGPRVLIEEITPLPEAWALFWDAVNTLDVWKWPQRIVADGPPAPDGTAWSLALKRGDKRLKASGHNAFPALEDFRLYCDAIRALLGDRYFPRP